VLPALERKAAFRPEDVLRGGYCVQDPGAATRVVLVATGSTVALTVAALSWRIPATCCGSRIRLIKTVAAIEVP